MTPDLRYFLSFTARGLVVMALALTVALAIVLW